MMQALLLLGQSANRNMCSFKYQQSVTSNSTEFFENEDSDATLLLLIHVS
jgi:hypothetical protein